MRKPQEIATAFSPRGELASAQRYFLVGIGGAGMSALARLLAARNHRVSGTDTTAGPETVRLQEEGFDVHIGHSGEHLQVGDAVILTDAIDLASSPEVARARELGLGVFRRSQALGWLLKDYQVIAVTGTHGKTTTTGMIGAGMIAAGLDPLVVVGATIPAWYGPVHEGHGKWAVVEACEAYDSFHDLDPALVVLTNLELDHVDYHENWENLRASVVRFADSVADGGMLIYCADDRGASEVAEHSTARAFGYGASREWLAQTLNKVQGLMPGLEIEAGTNLPEIDSLTGLALPGKHNVLNAIGALVACTFADADRDLAYEGIRAFTGAERRLQVLYDEDLTVVDDYAHHPTEVRATLQALRAKYEGRRLTVVFQPHLYSRTAGLIPEFADALSAADRVVVTDIYPAREAPMPGVSSARIAELVTSQARYIPSRHLLAREVALMSQPGDVVVGMGAGSIQEFGPALVREWARRTDPTRKTRVAVALGGDTSEREVSLHSGRAVLSALRAKGYDAFPIDVSDSLLSRGDLSDLVGPNRPDVVFLAIHGTHQEGGGMQGLCEVLHLPYTGSSQLASALAMDKQAAKDVLARAGLRVPRGVQIEHGEPYNLGDLQPPVVVKPNAEGSTVGLSFVETEGDLIPAIQKALAYDRRILVEEWLKGTEISVPVLDGTAYPVVEIVPRSGRYDFGMKYLPGATEEIVPARLEPEVYALAQRMAEAAHAALGCAGATRTDMIVLDSGEPVILEVNTLPGLTATSLLPNSAKSAGMDFESLVAWIVEDALTRSKAR